MTNPSIYKYHPINKFLYDIIINNELWYQKPSNFNDPYDCNLNHKPIKDESELIQLLAKENHNEILNEIKSYLPLSKKKFEALRKDLQRSGIESLERFGVSCFSYDCDSILMWSHYANDHKGVCLKFDTNYDPNSFRLGLNVEYVKTYPKIDQLKEEIHDLIFKTAKYKHIDWKYENEIRIINFDGSGLRKFNISALRGIIFGSRCSEIDKKSILSGCGSNLM